mmetsp:Transcript_2226/g.5653  ORF Transcript_2226/g.5653 Transcript_2226/m.5653 type:complete len:132 (+) Transcript_2226:288-683(+)
MGWPLRAVVGGRHLKGEHNLPMFPLKVRSNVRASLNSPSNIETHLLSQQLRSSSPIVCIAALTHISLRESSSQVRAHPRQDGFLDSVSMFSVQINASSCLSSCLLRQSNVSRSRQKFSCQAHVASALADAP